MIASSVGGISMIRSIDPASNGAGTVNGTAIDTNGLSEVLFALLCGTSAATSTLDVKIQESDDGSTGWVDITGAAFAQVTTTNDNANYYGRVQCGVGRKRYFRPVLVTALAASLPAIVAIGLVGGMPDPGVTLAFSK